MRKGLTFPGVFFLILCVSFMITSILAYNFNEEHLKLAKKQAEDLQLRRIADSLEALASHTINRQFSYELPVVNHKVIPPGYPIVTDSGMASMTLYGGK